MQKYRRGLRRQIAFAAEGRKPSRKLPLIRFPAPGPQRPVRRRLACGAIAAAIDIRPAEPADLPRIFAIYNREVTDGTSTFDIETREAGRDDGWLTDRPPYHPVTVAVADGGEVAGWAAIGPWSPRGAYRRTGEVSVYVDPDRRGAGIGKALLTDLVERARALPEIHVLLARIAQPNPASVAAHAAAGFRSFGIQRRCGEKLGRIIDVELFDLDLDA